MANEHDMNPVEEAQLTDAVEQVEAVESEVVPSGKAAKFDRLMQDESGVHRLTGMYKN